MIETAGFQTDGVKLHLHLLQGIHPRVGPLPVRLLVCKTAISALPFLPKDPQNDSLM